MNYTNNKPTAKHITQSKFFKTNSTQNDKRKSWMCMRSRRSNLNKNVTKPSKLHLINLF